MHDLSTYNIGIPFKHELNLARLNRMCILSGAVFLGGKSNQRSQETKTKELSLVSDSVLSYSCHFTKKAIANN